MNPNVLTLAQHIINVTTGRWNSIVGKRCISQPHLDTETHVCVLHPTKGFRHIRKSRLGVR